MLVLRVHLIMGWWKQCIAGMQGVGHLLLCGPDSRLQECDWFLNAWCVNRNEAACAVNYTASVRWFNVKHPVRMKEELNHVYDLKVIKKMLFKFCCCNLLFVTEKEKWHNNYLFRTGDVCVCRGTVSEEQIYEVLRGKWSCQLNLAQTKRHKETESYISSKITSTNSEECV